MLRLCHQHARVAVFAAALWLLPAGCAESACDVHQRAARVGATEVCVEIAARPSTRSTGLMHRESMDESEGMLFLFPSQSQGGFWMKNTLIPLSIAFIDERWHIVEIRDMEPHDLTSTRPAVAYRYALEVNQGWFQRHGIEAGARVSVDIRGVDVQ